MLEIGALGSVRLWALVFASGAAACATVRASYPSWEPTPPSVPKVRDRGRALADLEVSRKLWLERGWQQYSYVRARQTSSEDVEFTLLVVHEGSVVERSLLTSKTDSSGLGDRLVGDVGRAPQLLWRERGREIGRHDAGAPALTMDQLYDLCRDRVLSARTEQAPRLSFHRDGLLQHCGFLSQDCDDCPVASMQTIGSATPKPWQVPADVLCTDRYGLFLHDQDALTTGACEMCSCMANNLSDPHPPPPPPSPPPLAPEELELCRLSGREDCVEQGEGVGDICKIDPAACPRGELLPDRANWFCKHLLSADCGGGLVRHLTPECLALPRPTSGADPDWKLRCQPGR